MAQAQRTTEQLIQAVREASNEETPSPTAGFVTDVEILRRIVEAQYDLYDLMLTADPHLFMLSANFTLTSSNIYALSTLPDPGFYRFIGLDFLTGGQPPKSVPRYTFAERNRYSGQNFAGNYTLYYTPRLAELTTGGGKLDVFTDNYQKYIIAHAAENIMAKAEESDPSSMIAERQFQEKRILGSISARIQSPQQIPLPSEVDDDDWFYSGGGYRAYDVQGPNLVIR